MACETMFYSPHAVSLSLSNEEVDAWADYCDRTDAGVFDEVVRGQPGPAPSKWSVLPSQTRQPWDWLSESDQEGEIMRSALEG